MEAETHLFWWQMESGRMAQFGKIGWKSMRALLLAGVAAAALSACASNRSTTMSSPDYSGLSRAETHANVSQLSAQYAARPNDRATIISFAAALRAAGQAKQAIAVMQKAIGQHPRDMSIKIAYAKALAADGQFAQGLTIIEQTIQPERPDWNALLVKGAILDQLGEHTLARQLYKQGLVIAPGRAALEANLGLSYAMTNDLKKAEHHLRRAVTYSDATAQIRQNLALVLGLQGRFDEARSIYRQTLPDDEVESNRAYIRALLTQQNRWDAIKDAG
jgi:Flp pilus assembly protein TadD